MRKFFVITLWTIMLLGLLAVGSGFYAISKGWIGQLPPIEDLQNPINRYATQVLSADGKVMGTWNYNRENRILVDYSQLPPHLVKALVATEDARFYDHSGIDFIAVARAVVKRGLLRQKSAGGGSTITQQLAKQLYSPRAHSSMERLFQKPIEWVIAVQLERYYTKDEIVALYLNYFDFLHNAVGIKTAAATYFSKLPQELDTCEAATLVGLCKNPALFNPVRYNERSRERRNVVLHQMLREGYLSQAEYDTLSHRPLKLHFHPSDHKDGTANYFRDFLRRYMMAKQPVRSNYPKWNYVKFHLDSLAWIEDPLYGWCNKNTKRDGTPYNLYTDGLKVYTTIDSRMQQYAEQACMEHVAGYLQPAFRKENQRKSTAPFSGNLTAEQVRGILDRSMRQSDRWRTMTAAGYSKEEIQQAFNRRTDMQVFTYHGLVDTVMTPMDSIRYMKSFLRCGFVSMEPQSGEVRAYVGGLDFKHFNYDMATEGRRQVGSTIKPFLYSLAMENGYTPCDEAPNVQQTYIVAGRPWTPRNGSRSRYGEMVTLRWGLQQSNNWISAWLMSHLNPSAFVRILRDFGLNNPDIVPSMALCLGPCDLTVQEMVSAYTTFANRGIRVAPLYVTKIEDLDGNVLAQFQPRMNEVISEQSAYRMLSMLRSVVDGGTGSRLRFRHNLQGEIAAKTGTTNGNSDAWFMGITPHLVSGCWVGGEDRDIHFDSMQWGQGASMALPVWAYYMKRVYADERLPYDEKMSFDVPADFDPCAATAADSLDVNSVNDSTAIDIDEIFE
ncbi:MAG: transglycosylase domain-containing protein [Prevotella sp.]|nr:transglycosylase domain-containing protein [Prevotella sp.]